VSARPRPGRADDGGREPAARAAHDRLQQHRVVVKQLERSLHFYVDLVGYTQIGPPVRGSSTVLDRVLGLTTPRTGSRP
jgi:hypothetical protein